MKNSDFFLNIAIKELNLSISQIIRLINN